MQFSKTAILTTLAIASASASDLPYHYTNDQGPFEMSWGFSGSGSSEEIEIEFSLPSDIFIGLGIDCESSKMCDMIVGNGGGRTPSFIGDYFEVEGDREPHTDEDLGGTNDVTLISAKYEDYYSILRFTRKLNTGDKWDSVIKKEKMNLVYAWCEEPFCTDTSSAHAPGSWEIIELDMSGKGHESTSTSIKSLRNTTSSELDCRAGSEDLCSCSELIKFKAIESFDDCTQTAAIAFCKANPDVIC